MIAYRALCQCNGDLFYVLKFTPSLQEEECSKPVPSSHVPHTLMEGTVPWWAQLFEASILVEITTKHRKNAKRKTLEVLSFVTI